MVNFNKQQQAVIESAVYWYNNSSDLVFEYCGLAGTGKSLVLAEIIRRLDIPLDKIAPMAYTGAAAIVLRQKGLDNAKTIHSWLYQPVESIIKDKDGVVVMDDYFNRPKFRLTFEPKPLYNIDLIIIDEASMVPLSIKNEIESRGIKIIATGDLGQLPPVSDYPAYLQSPNILSLTEIMRQANGSDIIEAASRARMGLQIPNGRYNNLLVINEDEVTDQMLLSSEVILCGRNATRDYYNNKMRMLRGFESDLPLNTDILICRKNDWDTEVDGINLTNGLRGIVSNYPSVSGFDGKNFTIDFLPFCGKQPFRELKCDYKYFKASTNEKAILKNDRFATGKKMEYGYALTTHLSQGSQYGSVIYFEEYLSADIQNRLNYTAITRAVNYLIYVKRKKRIW